MNVSGISCVYINIGYLYLPAGIYFYSSFTISAWVNIVTVQYYSRLIDFGDGSLRDSVVFILSEDMFSRPYFVAFNDGINTMRIYSTIRLVPGTWNHLAVTYDSCLKRLSFFVNGTLDSTKPNVEGIRPIIRLNNYVGKNNLVYQPNSDAFVRQLNIFNSSLNDYEVRSLFLAF